MKRALILISILILLLIPCSVAYAYDGANATETSMTIEPADATSAPHIDVFGNAIGGVEAGDLFFIDISNTPLDTPFTLYMTNVDELVHSYRYMNLNVGIYIQTDTGNWEKMNAMAGEPYPDIYITMQNGLVSFTLPGNAKYKVTIDDGCFRCYGITPGKSIEIPSFYLTAS
jgi:hypothetical protein